MNHFFLNGRDFLSVEDMLDVQEYGVSELVSQNLTTREAFKELYKIQLYLYEKEKLKYKPCPICLTRHVGCTRRCRYCGSLSCPRCCMEEWYPIATAGRTRSGNYNIEDKRCNLCHMKCHTCNEVYQRGDNHEH